jgi:predicted HTH domain antitoxin
MVTLTLEIPEPIFSFMRVTPENFTEQMKLTAAIEWYEQGKISQEIAASIAGLDRTDFLLTLARLGKDSFKVDFNDLDKELNRE